MVAESLGDAYFQSFIKRVNITHSHSHRVDFGINVLHSGELVAPGRGRKKHIYYKKGLFFSLFLNDSQMLVVYNVASVPFLREDYRLVSC